MIKLNTNYSTNYQYSQRQNERSRTQKQHFPDDFQKLLDLITKHRLTSAIAFPSEVEGGAA